MRTLKMTSRSKYVIKPEEELRKEFNEFIKKNPYASRNAIRLALGTTVARLESLGLALPPKIPPSAAATLARKRGGWGSNFRLPGSPK